MFRASSEIAVDTRTRSVAGKPHHPASSRPFWRAATMSVSESMGTLTSPAMSASLMRQSFRSSSGRRSSTRDPMGRPRSDGAEGGTRLTALSDSPSFSRFSLLRSPFAHRQRVYACGRKCTRFRGGVREKYGGSWGSPPSRGLSARILGAAGLWLSLERYFDARSRTGGGSRDEADVTLCVHIGVQFDLLQGVIPGRGLNALEYSPYFLDEVFELRGELVRRNLERAPERAVKGSRSIDDDDRYDVLRSRFFIGVSRRGDDRPRGRGATREEHGDGKAYQRPAIGYDLTYDGLRLVGDVGALAGIDRAGHALSSFAARTAPSSTIWRSCAAVIVAIKLFPFHEISMSSSSSSGRGRCNMKY